MTRTSVLAMILLTAAGLGQAVAAPTHSTVGRQGHDAHLKLDWSLSWIAVSGLRSGQVQARVNHAVAREVASIRDALRAEIAAGPQPERPNRLAVNASVGVLTADLLSVFLDVHTARDGALERQTARTLTYDLRTGLAIPVRGLLRPGNSALTQVADLVDSRLRLAHPTTDFPILRPADLTTAIVEPDALWVIIHAHGRTYGVRLLYAELEDLGVLATDGAMGRWRRSTVGLTGALRR
jgi:hypothetical protein